MLARWPLIKNMAPIAAVVIRWMIVVGLLIGLLAGPVSTSIARWWQAGLSASEDGDYQTALREWDAVAERIGSHPVLDNALIETSLAAEDYAAARLYVYAAAARAGWTPERLAQLRVIAEKVGDTTQANAIFTASIDQTNQNPEALRQLAVHQIAQLDWDQAEITLARLVTLVPDDAQAFFQLGLLVAPENPSYAADYLARAALNPAWTERVAAIQAALTAYETESRSAAHTTLGITLIGLGEWAFAERALNFALEANAVNPTALAYRGFVRDQQDRDGLTDIEAARDMSPNDPVIFYLLGMHWRLAQQHTDAYVAFERAYWLDPDNPALAAEVGISLQQMSEFTATEEWLRRAVDLAPGELIWQKQLAAFYADTGFNLETGGFDFIAEVAQRNPDDPDLRASWGWAYAQQGDITRAYEELNAAVSLDPLNPRSRYYFGAILERRGDTDGAADSYWFVVQQSDADRGFGLLAARALQRLGYISS